MKKPLLVPILLLTLSPSLLHAAFGINFTRNTGNPTSGSYDGVAYTDWTGTAIVTGGTVASHDSTTFTLPQSVTSNRLTGWYGATDYWNPGTSGSPSNIFGSTLGSNNNGSTGLSGYSSIIQFTNVAAWLADNGYSSLAVTVYYSGYANNTASAGLGSNGAARILDGVITTANAGAFTSTQALIGTASGTISGGTTGIYYGKGVVAGLTGDFLVAAPDVASVTGGIAAIKIEGTPVPEPATYGLSGLGILATAAAVRRRRRVR